MGNAPKLYRKPKTSVDGTPILDTDRHYIFEDTANTIGIDIFEQAARRLNLNNEGRILLTFFDNETIQEGLKRYGFRKVEQPWPYFFKICKAVAEEQGKSLDYRYYNELFEQNNMTQTTPIYGYVYKQDDETQEKIVSNKRPEKREDLIVYLQKELNNWNSILENWFDHAPNAKIINPQLLKTLLLLAKKRKNDCEEELKELIGQ